MPFPTKPEIALRTVTERDVPTLVALNRAAYPDLAEQEVVFTDAQLRAHATVFPRGQILAEIDGVVVGAIATLIVSPAFDPLAAHSWSQATGDGFLTTHDSAGDTLYLADIYVGRAAWGRGVGTALYDALRALCRSLGLARIVAGGRLWGYHAVAHERTPDEYVAEVVAGTRVDRVLGSQLKAGFEVRGILPSYLPDPKSCDFASLLEWVNPERAKGVLPRSAIAPGHAAAQAPGLESDRLSGQPLRPTA
jgi:GNAT superfamily N-acetyltransferase